MRQWEAVHPYNAAQIMRLAGRADAGAAAAAWNDAVISLGLGPLTIRRGRFQYSPSPSTLGEGKGGGPAILLPVGTDLADHVSRELNRPFESNHYLPFRPFLIQESDSYFAGVVYQHWTADSSSIRALMRQWFCLMVDPAQARHQAMSMPRGGYLRYFGPKKCQCGWGAQTLMFAQSSRRLRQVRRLDDPRSSDMTMRTTIHRLGPTALATALPSARRRGATLNDLFLACIAQVCDQYVPSRFTRRRRDLALATIVDLRSRSREKLDDLFGLFLGYANVICAQDDLADFPALLGSIAAQTRRHKAVDEAQASATWMAVAMLACAFHPRAKRVPFFRKHVPLSAGISNVNLNQSWCAAYYPRPLMEYLRVSPTGPMVPVIFTPTTLGNDLHFALTYRTAVISAAAAQGMAQRFIELLTNSAAPFCV